MAQSRGRHSHAERRDHYQEVTDRIVAALEAGTKPWQAPWSKDNASRRAMPFNATSGRRYHGINVLLLAMSSFALGGDPRFCTYKQAAERGWRVRRGEHGTTVFFVKRIEMDDRDAPPDAQDRTKRVAVLRAYTVFNGAQLDGIPAYVGPTIGEAPWRRPNAAQVIVEKGGAVVRIGGKQPFYSPKLDFVQMPPDVCFPDAETWSATILHELAHWSGAPTRLDRDLSARFGSGAYAQEELRAELASCFLGAELGLPCDITDHASYIAEWAEALKQDKREIFRAAADAQKIADYLLAFHPEYARLAAEQDDDPDQATAAQPEAIVAQAA